MLLNLPDESNRVFADSTKVKATLWQIVGQICIMVLFSWCTVKVNMKGKLNLHLPEAFVLSIH